MFRQPCEPNRGREPAQTALTAMAKHSSDFLNVLDERGFIHQCSDFAGLDALAAKGEVVAYVGYDCTAPSLHVGHLISIMMLHWLQQTGGKPIALMGGGTTRVGDPSGKDETRRILPIETIEANKDAIKGVFARFLKFGKGSTDAIMLDNAEWLAPLNYIEFLRDVGRHFSVNRMLTMDSAKLRLERDQELSFIEFNYMLLQAYDFVELAKRYGCNLQMGGSDQWGNIVTGIDLGRRMGTHQLYALTCPLLTTASGAKMGKTAAGAVWLNEEQLCRLRLLAVLAQHRGRRRRPLPEAVHHAAAGRDRQAGGAAGRGDQRGQEGAGDRGDGAAARPREGRGRRQDGAGDLREGRHQRGPADGRDRGQRAQRGPRRAGGLRARPASSSRTARRAARSRAAACASTMLR